MSKRYNIRWRDKDEQELQRVVNNFNSKIRRASKKNQALVDFLPKKVSVKDLKSKITTRSDFNRNLKSLKRFSEKGAEKLVEPKNKLKPTKIEKEIMEAETPLTNYMLKERRIKTRTVNASRAKELKALNVSAKLGNMSTIEKANLKPKQLVLSKSQEAWNKFDESLEKEIQSNFKEQGYQAYKDNYLKGLKNDVNDIEDRVFNMVKDLDAKELFDKSVSNPRLQIKFHYDPLDDGVVGDTLFEEWSNILGG